MKNLGKGFLILIAMMSVMQAAQAESLFVLGASQSFYAAEPKSLYGSVRARSVGDLVTIILSERVTFSDSLNYAAERSSNTVDNFTTFINKLLPGVPLNNQFNNFGGSNQVDSQTSNERSLNVSDYVTVQVVQLLPNGNLMVQGKKTLLNGNERVDLLVSGVVDPRWINDTGQVSSRNVANLQFALAGKGSISRGSNEGIFNRVIRYLF
ncbi:TPA: flagellar basal body L-ring protein FlgH [Candidatus Spyradomonas excrementavium]|nr:flagellar basal body L-ring protein FlgH [Candidatus Spyradomonas excrementavium]